MGRSLQQPHTATIKATITPPHQVSKSVTLTETYSVATIVRHKLGQEADRSEYQLRRLVAHANTLDLLMEELSDRERGLESRFNALIRAAPVPQRSRNVSWMDTIVEEIEETEEVEEIEEYDDSDSDSDFDDSDDDSDAEDGETCRATKAKSPRPKQWAEYFAKDELSEEDEEAQDIELVLRRWPSGGSVPELIEDLESDSDDERSYADRLPSFPKQCAFTTTANLKADVRETAVAVLS